MANARAAGPMLTALGDPTRRRIFERVGQGPLPVNEIAAGLPISRPAVSQHLKVLKRTGLVVDRAEGTRRIYQVNPDALRVIRTYLERFQEDALAAFKMEAGCVARSEPTVVTPDPEVVD